MPITVDEARSFAESDEKAARRALMLPPPRLRSPRVKGKVISKSHTSRKLLAPGRIGNKRPAPGNIVRRSALG